MFITFDKYHIKGGLIRFKINALNDSQNCKKLGTSAADLRLQFSSDQHTSATLRCGRFVPISTLQLLYGVGDSYRSAHLSYPIVWAIQTDQHT
jgi:hypothetical protein